MFGSVRQSVTSKVLSNTFRMTHAVVASLPLMIINIVSLINVLRVDGLEDYAIDFTLLHDHMSDGKYDFTDFLFDIKIILFSVHMHGLAFFFSFFNFARAASLFNERLTYTMLFTTVALPFTILTSLSRVILVAIVVAFIEPEWTAILLAG